MSREQKYKRQTYFNNLNEETVNVQLDVLRDLLKEDKIHLEDFMERWRKKNQTNYIMAQDPDYVVWLKEGEQGRRIEIPVEDEEGGEEEPIVLIRAKPETKPVMPEKSAEA